MGYPEHNDGPTKKEMVRTAEIIVSRRAAQLRYLRDWLETGEKYHLFVGLYRFSAALAVKARCNLAHLVIY